MTKWRRAEHWVFISSSGPLGSLDFLRAGKRRGILVPRKVALRRRVGLPHAHPVDIHAVRKLLAVEAGSFPIGGEEAEDQVLWHLRDALVGPVGLVAIHSEDVALRRPLHGVDVEVIAGQFTLRQD